ncbi:MAG: glycerophosphodiester phosphodiesterase family protein [Chlamydiales bacterium]|nr:glycerophosphodiester phosphodiesterase family protein [Chlamydiales bacterium]
MNTPLLIAHRGASKEAPENTLVSIQKALSLGSDLIECDIHCSKDLIPVVIHDSTIKRTTNAKKQAQVSSLSLKELKMLDAGSWFSSDFKDERIPTLEEVLELTTKLIIEVKISKPNDFLILNPLLSLLKKHPGSLVGSFSHEFLQEVKKTDPNICLVGIADTIPSLKKHLSLGIKIISLKESLVTEKLVHSLKQSDIILFTWTVDDKSRFSTLASYGVDGIITNNPKLRLCLR